jgi:hypothetical protein
MNAHTYCSRESSVAATIALDRVVFCIECAISWTLSHTMRFLSCLLLLLLMMMLSFCALLMSTFGVNDVLIVNRAIIFLCVYIIMIYYLSCELDCPTEMCSRMHHDIKDNTRWDDPSDG